MGDWSGLSLVLDERDRGVIEEVLGVWDGEDGHPGRPDRIVADMRVGVRKAAAGWDVPPDG